MKLRFCWWLKPDEKDRILRGFELGVNDWLMQPLDPHELRARARNQIRRKFYQDRLRSDLGTALELALTDPLTGLYNQRYLRRHLSGLMETGQGRQLAVLMIDVDHFKSVNDRFGHASGDRALRLIADSLRGNTRVFDFGGALWRRGIRRCHARHRTGRSRRSGGTASLRCRRN